MHLAGWEFFHQSCWEWGRDKFSQQSPKIHLISFPLFIYDLFHISLTLLLLFTFLRRLTSEARLSKVPITFRARKVVLFLHSRSEFQQFWIDTISKLSIIDAKLIGLNLWARNCGTVQLLLISKFAFAPEKLPGLSRNGLQGCKILKLMMTSKWDENGSAVSFFGQSSAAIIATYCQPSFLKLGALQGNKASSLFGHFSTTDELNLKGLPNFFKL